MKSILILAILIFLPSCIIVTEPLTCEWVETTHCYDVCYDRPVCERWCYYGGTCEDSCWIEEECKLECSPQYEEYCY